MRLSTKSFRENILNSLGVPVFVKDSDHKWVMVNKAFCDMIGRESKELLDKSDFDFFPADEAQVFWDMDSQVFETGEENINEEVFTDAKGIGYIILTKRNLVKDEDGACFLVGVIHDVTERKKLIDSLKNSNSLLENYANMVSHDLLAPLRTLTGFADLLKTTATDKLEDSEKRYLDMIYKSAIRMGNLVEKLLRFSSINHKDLELSKIVTRDFFRETIFDLGSELENIPYSVTHGEYPVRIVGDRKLLKMLLQNVLSNAIKFRSPERKLNIDVSVEDLGNSYEFTIKDNGIGMGEGDLVKIFDMFTRLNSTRRYEGSGIGLSLCRLIVKLHNGSIAAHSKLGSGSTIVFSIGKFLDWKDKVPDLKHSLKRIENKNGNID